MRKTPTTKVSKKKKKLTAAYDKKEFVLHVFESGKKGERKEKRVNEKKERE